MAAYGAAVSLSKALSLLQNTPNYPYPQIGVLLEEVDSLRRFLEENREVKREFEIQIRDAIYEAQDILDSHLSSTHFLSPSEAETRNQSFCQDLERVIQRVNSLAEMTKSEEFNHLTLDRKISNSVWKTPDEFDVSCLLAHSVPVAGRDEESSQLKERLMSGSAGLEVVPIVGIAGMGKTALARWIYEDPLIKEYFDASGWVKVSIEYNKRDKLLDLLESIKRRAAGINQEAGIHLVQYNWSDEVEQKTDDQLVKHLYNSLKYKRYLIVLDDIRELAPWNDLKKLLPDYHVGSRILLTTRDVDIARTAGTPHQLGRLSDADTLSLLQKKIYFGQPSCPPNLAVITEDIVRSCRGFPHAVVIVGKLLLCAKPVAEYWQMVLSSINTCENYVDLMEALISLTYSHLPQRLKVCLLYMAIFPYNYSIPFLKLVMMWTVERFVEIINAGECWVELCLRGFLVIRSKAKDKLSVTSEIGEEIYHDFLVRKAKEENFFLVINKDTSYVSLQEDTTYNQQRRLCIQQNIRHFIKDLSKSNPNSSVRSLIFSGPMHQYPLQAWLEDFKLLELLDAPNICFYTFPPQILKLVQLRHLAFSYNKPLPATMCNLHNLQVLIVSHYFNLKYSGIPSYLPAEIWNLKELMHLQVMGSDLPEPPLGTDLLKTLKRLSDVSARSCTQNILERLTNLGILEVLIESSPEDESLSFFSHLNILNRLSVFKCVVMYPDIGTQVVPSSIPAFPSTLTRLTLSGCGFPWKYMRAIATLPELQILKLQTYAFQGPHWEVKTDEFPKLDFLLLEDMDFENWTFPSTGSSFPMLECLTIRHCHKLQNIPSVFVDSSTLEILQVVDCSTSAMNSALDIKVEKLNRGIHSTQFYIYSSRDD